MKIVIISDTHASHYMLKNIPDGDVLIHCGDFMGNDMIVQAVDFGNWFSNFNHKHKILVPGNHDCLDSDTELLTKRGWISYSHIRNDDKVYSYNIKNNYGEWVKIKEIIIKPYNGILNLFDTNGFNQLATPNHRNLYKIYKYDSNYTSKYTSWIINTFTNNGYIKILKSSICKGNNEINLTDDQIKLVAWLMTDGCKSKKGYYTIYQSKKIYVDEIRELLNRLNYSYKERNRKRNLIGTQIKGKIIKSCLNQTEFDIHAVSGKEISSYFNGNIWFDKKLYKMSNRQFEIFLDIIIKADGSPNTNQKNKWSCILYENKQLLDALQILCILNGFTFTITQDNRGDWRAYITKRTEHCFRLQKIRKEIKYDDNVWCLSVPNENFMVRRNGKHYFTGNCCAEENLNVVKGLFMNTNILVDNVKIINKTVFYGTPYQPYYNGWSYNVASDKDRERIFNKIPDNTEVLITHTMPYGILDKTSRGDHIGDLILLKRIQQLKKLKVHIFGHNHNGYGITEQGCVTFVNASSMDENYDIVNKPIVIDL